MECFIASVVPFDSIAFTIADPCFIGSSDPCFIMASTIASIIADQFIIHQLVTDPFIIADPLVTDPFIIHCPLAIVPLVIGPFIILHLAIKSFIQPLVIVTFIVLPLVIIPYSANSYSAAITKASFLDSVCFSTVTKYLNSLRL